MRQFHVKPGREPDYCPFCGEELVFETPGHSRTLRNPGHSLWNQSHKNIGGIEYVFDTIRCGGDR